MSETGGTRTLNLNEYRDRVIGAWYGKNVGVTLGLTFEGRAKAPGPIKSYVQWKDPDHPAAGLEPAHPMAAPCDDDTYCDLVALRAFERFGASLTPRQLGEQWIADGAGFQAASRAARQAMLAGHWPPESGHPDHNPHYNTIAAQFSSVIYGILAPGNINCAAATARAFSHINGYAEGSDGGVLFAALASEVLFENDTVRAIERALAVLDPKAPTRLACQEILDFHAQKTPWSQAAERSQARWKAAYPQTNNAVANAALTILGLVYGAGDFLHTVSIICQAADNADTDCNAGIAGAIFGAQGRLRRVPARLVVPLNDTYQVRPHPNVTDMQVAPRDERLSDIALRLAIQGSRFSIARGGATRDDNYLVIPNPEPVAQPPETWPVR
jgi:hypothetical protein